VTIDDLEALEAPARSPEELRAAAAQLVAWSRETHPEDDEEITPALLLVHAGELLSQAGDHEGALDLFRRAEAAEGDAPPDTRCYLHHGLLAAGDAEGARRLAEEVRRSRPADPDTYLLIGQDYAQAGDLAEVNRWLNLGLRRLLAQLQDEDPDLSGVGAVMLLAARRRVRRELGFPPDEFDLHPLLPPTPE
jgi:tetratricopeptide (TPR) repeat protein